MVTMRRNRIILFMLWILSLVGISFYGGEVSYRIFELITLIPVISVIYILFMLICFKIYQRPEGREVIAGRPAPFYFTLQNESFFTFSGVRVIFYSSFSTISGLSDTVEYELKPRSGIKKETRLLCRYRGEYDVGIKSIVFQDFFRLFTVTYRNREPFRVIVKPDIIYLNTLANTDPVLNAVLETKSEQTEPDLLMREYVPGDDIRFINWKASAGYGKLMIRERSGTRQNGIGMIMDPLRESKNPEVYLPLENRILETVIALNVYFSKNNIPVTTWYGGAKSVVEKDSGFESFYDAMSSFSFSPELTVSRVVEEALSEGSVFSLKVLFMVLHSWDSNAESAVFKLGSAGIPVIVYLVTDTTGSLSIEHIPGNASLIRIPVDKSLAEVI
ncbi:MAG TPA: hypothetical protein DCW47_02760 [Lachnospiraceae bacterium]|nr:hypothetical protein [Lachnospiraceae bacterium]